MAGTCVWGSPEAISALLICVNLLSSHVAAQFSVCGYLQGLFLVLQALILLLKELQSLVSGGKLLLIVLRQSFGTLKAARFAFLLFVPYKVLRGSGPSYGTRSQDLQAPLWFRVRLTCGTAGRFLPSAPNDGGGISRGSVSAMPPPG